MIKSALEAIVGITGASAADIAQYLTENVLNQVVDLLPLVVPVIIGFIAFRKGYRFLKSALRSA